MYIENRCRPRAATVKIRKHYLPVGHLSPLEGTAFAGANRRGEGVSLAVLPPFLCAVKEMGVNIILNGVVLLKTIPPSASQTPPFAQGRLFYSKNIYSFVIHFSALM